MKIVHSVTASLSKRFGLDVQYFINAGFWPQFKIWTDALLGLLLLVSITQNYSQTEVGIYFLVNSIYAITSVLCLPGFGTALISSFIQGYYSSYKRVIKIRLLGSLSASLLLLICAVVAFQVESQLWQYFLLLCLVMPTSALTGYLDYNYQKDRFRHRALIASVKSILYYGTAITLSVLGLPIIAVIASIYVVQLVFNLAFTIGHIKKIHRVENNENKDPDLINKGTKFSLAMITGTISQNIDKLILPYFLGLPQLSVYSLALALPKEVFKVIRATLSSLLLKKTGTTSFAKIKQKVSDNRAYVILILLSVPVFLWFAIPLAIRTLFPQYIAAIEYARVFGIFASVVIIEHFGITTFRSTGQPGKYFKAQTIGKLGEIIGFVILIPLMGIWGAIVSKGISYAISASVGLYYLNQIS